MKVNEDLLCKVNLELVIELAKKGCPSFYSVFAIVYPEFNKKLRSLDPSLNPDDLAVCAYTKIGFKTLQIAHFSKSTLRAIDSRKYRIRKSLNVPKGEDFRMFINNL